MIIFIILVTLRLKKLVIVKIFTALIPYNPLIIHSAAGYFKENNGEKYLILDPIEKYEEDFSGIKSEIETINSREKMYYEKNYAKISTDDIVPLNVSLKFPTLTIIVRCVFQDKKLYLQVYLDECLYEL